MNQAIEMAQQSLGQFAKVGPDNADTQIMASPSEPLAAPPSTASSPASLDLHTPLARSLLPELDAKATPEKLEQPTGKGRTLKQDTFAKEKGPEAMTIELNPEIIAKGLEPEAMAHASKPEVVASEAKPEAMANAAMANELKPVDEAASVADKCTDFDPATYQAGICVARALLSLYI